MRFIRRPGEFSYAQINRRSCRRPRVKAIGKTISWNVEIGCRGDQTLGGLGLLLGTIGLAAVLIRNALERRRELALLRAVGYRRSHLSLMLMAENGLLLVSGLATGTVTALVAIVPALVSRGSPLPAQGILVLLLGVLLLGLAVSRLAVALVHRLPLLATLRAE